MTKIKICGLSREEDVAGANAAGPDYAGFVFAPGSRRRVTAARAAALSARLAPEVTAVGVFVDAPVEEIAALYRDGVIALAQLHGHEDAAYIRRLREAAAGARPAGRDALGVILALRGDDLAALAGGRGDAAGHEKIRGADFLLFDAGAGSGAVFDWGLVPGLLANLRGAGLEKNWFLAGGLGLHNIAAALALRPFGIDVSSGAETGGLKDPRKMAALVQAAHTAR